MTVLFMTVLCMTILFMTMLFMLVENYRVCVADRGR